MTELYSGGIILKSFPQKKEVLIQLYSIKSGKPTTILIKVKKIKKYKNLFNKNTYLVLDSNQRIRVKNKKIYSKKEIKRILSEMSQIDL